MRFEIFKKSLALITEHNAKHKKGEVTFTMGLNQFSDWTDEERDKMHGGGIRRSEN